MTQDLLGLWQARPGKTVILQQTPLAMGVEKCLLHPFEVGFNTPISAKLRPFTLLRTWVQARRRRMQTPRPSSRTGGQSFVFVFAVVVACPGLARLHLVVCCTVFFLGRHSLSPRWFTRSAPLSLFVYLSLSLLVPRSRCICLWVFLVRPRSLPRMAGTVRGKSCKSQVGNDG